MGYLVKEERMEKPELQKELEQITQEIAQVKVPPFKDIVRLCSNKQNNLITTIVHSPTDYEVTEKGQKIVDELGKLLIGIDPNKLAKYMFEHFAALGQKLSLNEYLDNLSYVYLEEIKNLYNNQIKTLEEQVVGEKDQNMRLLSLSLLMAVDHYKNGMNNYIHEAGRTGNDIFVKLKEN